MVERGVVVMIEVAAGLATVVAAPERVVGAGLMCRSACGVVRVVWRSKTQTLAEVANFERSVDQAKGVAGSSGRKLGWRTRRWLVPGQCRMESPSEQVWVWKRRWVGGKCWFALFVFGKLGVGVDLDFAI